MPELSDDDNNELQELQLQTDEQLSKRDGNTSSLQKISSDENNIQIQELQNQIEKLTSLFNSAQEK